MANDPPLASTDPKALERLSELKSKRELLYAQAQTHLESFKKLDEKNVTSYKASFERLGKLTDKFERIQDAIQELNPILQPNERLEVFKVQRSFDELIQCMELLYCKFLSRQNNKASSSSSSSSIRLPQLELPQFNGNIDAWRSFRNLYNAAVHSSAVLHPVEKFQYLLGTLKGEAFDLVKGLDVTEANYTVAWKLLCQRYDCERRHVLHHFNSLLDLPEMKSNSQVPTFLTKLHEHTQALDALGHPLSSYEPMLMAVALRKISPFFRRRFEDYRGAQTAYPKMANFLAFLEKESLNSEEFTPTFRNSPKVLLTSPPSKREAGKPDTRSHRKPNIGASETCPKCKGPHSLYTCESFRSLAPPQRHESVQLLRRCYNCLGDHFFSDCQSKSVCRLCRKRHHTLLHVEVKNSDECASSSEPPSSLQRVLLGATKSTDTLALLSTVQLRVSSPSASITVRGVLDSAAQATFLTTQCAHALRLQVDPSFKEVSGISDSRVQVQGLGHVSLDTQDDQRLIDRHPVIVINKITTPTPTAPISNQVRSKLSNLPLADPHFDTPGPIDLLIGADLYPYLLTGELITLGPGFPVAMGTRMGFTIMGNAPSETKSPASPLTTLLCMPTKDINESIQRFWQIEEPQHVHAPVTEEDPAETIFSKSTERTPSGRFVVRLPFSDSPSKLGESRSRAEQRFYSLERRLQSDPALREHYVNFMQEYESSGVMSPAPSGLTEKPHFFLPHHGVIKESSSTTKLRIVFDASAKTSTGISLNDILHTGPSLVSDVRDVLINFRRHPIVFTCDIRQMYLQVHLHAEDRPFHLLLWRTSPSLPLKSFQLNTVTFGISSSAFLAMRSLKQLATEYQQIYPRASRALLEDVYVDDIVSGADTPSQALDLQNELIQLLQKGHFQLRKWTSNCPALLQGVPRDHLEIPVNWDNEQTSSFSILGLRWIPSQDVFTYKVQLLERPYTKRGVLSAIATIFDPCGWVAPVTFLAKSYMQQLWLLKLDWDSQLPSDFSTKWRRFLQELPSLNQIQMPRQFVEPNSTIELHGFCDASEAGYGAVVYIRSSSSDNSSRTALVTAKSKVAPLKRMSIPRLELCAATLLAHLLQYAESRLRVHYTISGTYAWSDSTITLHWLQIPTYKLKTFVANRTSQIQELVPNVTWGHVRSTENPADCLSRGLSASQLISHHLWWHGPYWLSSDSKIGIPQIPALSDCELPEVRQISNNLSVQLLPPTDDIFTRISSWSKLQRILAFVNRFTHNCQNPRNRHLGILAVSELQRAEQQMIRHIQRASLPDEIKLLEKGLTCTSRLVHLNPYLDEHNLIRVGGRLSNAPIDDSRRHPWVLPKDHNLVKALIQHFHILNLHAGPQLLQSILNQKYWILSGRSAIRAITHNCVKCFRTRPRPVNPLMGDLPSSRVTPARAFTSTGMDYAGPFTVKVHTLRSARLVQVYLCIFVCMVTKAVHLEVAQDLTADAFIAALTRLASRRGHPTDVYSDCGTNFTGACRILKETIQNLHSELSHDSKVQELSQYHQLTFHFNPPAAPHQGGLWEAAVKSAKTHLYKTIQGHTVTLEEFNTLTIKIEAMLNSRPLTPLSSDPSDLSPLTPAHFLTGGSLVSLPEPTREAPVTPLRRWHRIQAFSQTIWKRWSLEYLHTLQSRSKWTKPQKNLGVGDLVVVHDPHSPPLRWKMARILETFPGKDKVVRVAKVRTQTGELLRPVTKLYPLPT